MMKKLFLVLAMVASAYAWAESEVVDIPAEKATAFEGSRRPSVTWTS